MKGTGEVFFLQVGWTVFTLLCGYFEILPITVSSQTFPKLLYIVLLATYLITRNMTFV